MNLTLITVNSLSKSLNKKTILKNVDLLVQKNEIFGIIGISGSGKSTLLESIIGFHQPDKGDIKVYTDELDTKQNQGTVSVFKKTSYIDSIFGYAAQEPSFYGSLTVEQNLIYFGNLFEIPSLRIKEKITELLRIVDLTTERHAKADILSLGMQKRLDLACALVHDPPILILDEPSAELDIITRKKLWDAILKIRKQGHTVILATHSIDEVHALCDRIAILSQHSIQEVGTPEEIAQKLIPDHTIRLRTKDQNYTAILDSIKREKVPVHRAVKKEGQLILYTKKPTTVMKSVLTIIEYQQHVLHNITIQEPELEKAFEQVAK